MDPRQLPGQILVSQLEKALCKKGARSLLTTDSGRQNLWHYFISISYSYVMLIVVSFSGQRTKKWKYMYFVLNGTEQQLYYFENQKVSFY